MFVYYLHDEKDPQTFEQLALWFKNRYELVDYQTVEDCVYSRRRAPRKACMLSVDDGWISTYEVIFPILAKHNIPFTIFVSPEVAKNGGELWPKKLQYVDHAKFKEFLVESGYFKPEVMKFPLDLMLKEFTGDMIYKLFREFGTPEPTEQTFVNAAQLREMAASGLVEIGAHTLTHPILANESAERSLGEIAGSVKGLSELIGKPVRTFAYPNGMFSDDFAEREMDFARQAGLQTAFSVDPGYIGRGCNPYNLPRIGSTSRLKLGRLGALLPSLYNQAGKRRAIHALRQK